MLKAPLQLLFILLACHLEFPLPAIIFLCVKEDPVLLTSMRLVSPASISDLEQICNRASNRGPLQQSDRQRFGRRLMG